MYQCHSKLVLPPSSNIINTIPRQLTGIRQRLLQHLLRKLIIMSNFQRLMIIANGLIQLISQMINKSQGEKRLRVGWIETHTLLEEFY